MAFLATCSFFSLRLDMYSDEQAMTLDELELAKKLYAFCTVHKAYPGFKKINLLIDSQNWNNKQRPEAVHPIGAELLDPIFNTNIYQKTHLAYEKTFFYVDDGTHTLLGGTSRRYRRIKPRHMGCILMFVVIILFINTICMYNCVILSVVREG
jgi:hypothetical protein